MSARIRCWTSSEISLVLSFKGEKHAKSLFRMHFLLKKEEEEENNNFVVRVFQKVLVTAVYIILFQWPPALERYNLIVLKQNDDLHQIQRRLVPY